MKEEFDIWNEVLETAGFKLLEEYTGRTNNYIKYIKYEQDTHSEIFGRSSLATLHIKFKTGEVTNFSIDGWQMIETFQKENKDLFRAVKLKYLLEI